MKNAAAKNGFDGTKDVLNIKPSNIRIWIHERDIGKLTKALWEGHGMRLRTESSNNVRVKKFLESVPYLMNLIKDIHQAAIDNDVELLKEKTSPPVPPVVLSARDSNGLTALHKAAGLAHTSVVEYLLSVWPESATEKDVTGKTPLHYAASAKNNDRCFNLLVQAGADEEAQDNRQKVASYYRSRASDVERSNLTVVPEAPRIPQTAANEFDWNVINPDQHAKMTTSKSLSHPLSKVAAKEGLARIPKSLSTTAIVADNNKDEDEDQVAEDTAEDLNNNPVEEDVEPAVNGDEDNATDANNNNHDQEAPEDEGTMDENANDNVEFNGDVPEQDKEAEDQGDNVDTNEDEEMEQMVRRKNEMNASKSAEKEDPFEEDNDTAAAPEDMPQENETSGVTVNEEQDDDVNNNLVADKEEDDEDAKEDSFEPDELEEEKGDQDEDEDELPANDESDDEQLNVDGQCESPEAVDGVEEEDEPEETDEQEQQLNEEANESTEQDIVIDPSPEEEEEPDHDVQVEDRLDNSEEDLAEGVGEDNESPAAEIDVEEGEEEVEGQVQQPEIDDTEEVTETEEVTFYGPETETQDDNIDNNGGEEDQDEEDGAEDETPEEKDIDGAAEEEQNLDSNYTTNDDEFELETEEGGINGGDDEAIVDDNDEDVKGAPEVEQLEEGADSNEAHEINGDIYDEDDYEPIEGELPPEEEAFDVVAEGEGKEEEGLETESQLKEAGEDVVEQSSPADVKEEENSNEEKQDQENDEEEEDTSSQRPDPTDSPSPALQIEGRVEGEPDNRQTESGNAFDAAQAGGAGAISNIIGEDIRTTIDRGDMEQLAALVLNGEGAQLVGMESKQPEIQAFLDNVPAYMNKIRRVHLAAREGNLRDLQAALDRRKFAIARDEVSPSGASPLHVATIFGHTGIIRYLAGRFPETTNTLDDNNRTPLHYAAVVHDNGHFYNMLMHLGGNSKLVDGWGNSAEFYYHMTKDGRTSEALSHKSLLHDYGVPETMAEDMLSDQVPDDVHSARRSVDDVDVLSTLERCYKLIHDSRKQSLNSTAAHNYGTSSARISVITHLSRFLKRSIFDDIKHRQTRLDHNLFDVMWPAMKKANKERSIDEDLDAGVVIPDFDCYVVFQEFLVPLVFDIHGIEANSLMIDVVEEANEMRSVSVCSGHNKTMYFPLLAMNGEELEDREQSSRNNNRRMSRESDQSQQAPMNVLNEIRLNLDTTNKIIKACVVECSRNLEHYELPLNLSIGQLEQAERLVTGKLLTLDFARATDEDELGQYLTMNEILSMDQCTGMRQLLQASGLLIPILDVSDPQQISESLAINGQFWPYGRGVYISASQTLVVWVNAQEHLRVLCCTRGEERGDIGQAYSKCGKAIEYLERNLPFRQSYYLGNLSSRPSFLGTALKFYYTLELPNLMKDIENFRDLCAARGLQMTPRRRASTDSGRSSPDEGVSNDGSERIECLVRVSNRQSMGVNEWQLFMDYCTAIANILQLEKDMSMTNSKHIASMLVNIFRKKRHTLSDINQPEGN